MIRFNLDNILHKKERVDKMRIILEKDTRTYKKFITAEEFIKLENCSEEEKQVLLEKAKLEFNDPSINEMYGIQNDRETYTFTIKYYSKNEDTVDVTPGIYDLIETDGGSPTLVKTDITSLNKILPIHTELKKIFATVDFTKKNNMLIYGKPGNGKTQSIIDLSHDFQDIVFIKVNYVTLLRSLKAIKPEVKKVLIFEEFTETVVNSDKRVILNFLDGIDSVTNCISIMSTNYPEQLETNIIDRPSRVKHFIEYKNPDNDQIDIIAEHFKSDASFFYKKDYSVDNIINIINVSNETGMTLLEAETDIKFKRKFLSETFKNSGKMGI